MQTAPTRERQAVGAWELALAAHRTLFNGGDTLQYFRERGLAEEATGDAVADQILEALGAAGPNGMSRTDISHLFKRHKSAEHIGRALSLLLKTGRAKRKQDTGTGGRPSERWFAT